MLFQDRRFVVLNKPAGLPVHAGPSGGLSAEDWFPALARSGRDRRGPWLAHRLDADTAGCLVVALRKHALLQAQQEFAAGRAEKTYWAVVAGGPKDDRGSITLGLRKRIAPGGWRIVVDPEGQVALTEWRVLGRKDGLAWLELRPRTGRTHQLRVHCAAMGWPILGDALYGTGGTGLALLARSIRLALIPELAATAAPPPHMAMLGGWDAGTGASCPPAP